jgi:hypothetical protein
MTLEMVSVDKCRFLEQCRLPDLSGTLQGSEDHSASQADDQC